MESLARSSTSKEDETTDAVVAKKSKLIKPLPKCKTRFRTNVYSYSPANVAHVIRNFETHGRPPRHIFQLPIQLTQHKGVEAAADSDGSLQGSVLELYKHLDKKVVNLQDEKFVNSLENVLDNLLNDNKATESALFFHSARGIDLIADLLIKAFYDERDDIFELTEIKTVAAQDVSTVKIMLQIVYHCTQVHPFGLSHLCDRPHLLHFLFSLFADAEKKPFVDATLVLEEMILSGPQKPDINMQKIACLPALLHLKMNDLQEAHLYHVIATAISASDAVPSVDISLQDHDRWLMGKLDNQVNKRNQEFLISMEPFVEKLFKLTCHKLRYDLSSIHHILNRPEVASMLSEEQLHILYARILEEHPDNPIYQGHLYHEKSIRADAFLLLSLLLTGKCREQMQEYVLKYNLAQRLEEIVDKAVWKGLEAESMRDHFHADYECGPESTVKIQYLRLIYSVSYHHLHRYLILNEDELREIEEISVTKKVPLSENFETLDKSKCCKRRPGLLTQIIGKMRNETASSYIRFWMTRAIEAFLRGPTWHVNQIFLIEKNLVEDLFGVLLSNAKTSQEVIQGHFDLLASLMKDSIHAFRRFSNVVDCLDSFQKLCRTIDENLVDSNMFVRCVVLTIYHFDCVETEHRGFIEKCRILNHYANFAKRVQAVVNFVGLLSVSSLSQENVSCLNTSVIILLIAKTSDQLPKYLSAILNYEEVSNSERTGRKILEKLRQLLDFWLEHYTLPFKENDLKSLEESTGFEFSKWKEMVIELISPDVTSPNSIMHHISPLTPQYKLKASVVPSCIRTS